MKKKIDDLVEKKENDVRLIFVLALVAVVLVLWAVYAWSRPSAIEVNKSVNEPVVAEPKPYAETLGFMMRSFPDCSDKAERGYLPRQMFCQLPDKPADFDRVKLLYTYGRVNVSKYGRNYWVQPEWVDGFEKTTLPHLQKGYDGYVERYSIQTYPAEQLIEIDSEEFEQGDVVIDFELTARNSRFVIFYSGVKLKKYVPTSQSRMVVNSFSDNQAVVNNPSYASDFIGMSFEDDEFVLAPSFPVFTNSNGESYVKEIKGTITLKKSVFDKYEVSNQKFAVGISFTDPSRKFNEAGIDKYENKYLSVVQDAGNSPKVMFYLWVK